VTSDRESLDFIESEAQLGVIRLDYHATHKWDAVLEGRILDIGNGTITRNGGLAGVYRHVNDNAKIGVGVTWGGIEEEYLATISDEDDLGWYLCYRAVFLCKDLTGGEDVRLTAVSSYPLTSHKVQ